jgi:hypothetical protein
VFVVFQIKGLPAITLNILKSYYEFSRKHCGLLSLPKTGFGTSKSYQPHISPFNDSLNIGIVAFCLDLLFSVSSSKL